MLLRTEDDLTAFLEEAEAAGTFLPVVLADHTPWILFTNEDGDGYATSVPFEDIPSETTVTWGSLLGGTGSPLVVLWNGTPTYPEIEVRAVLEGIYEDARSTITAPVHHALMGAASRLERLLGLEPGVPPFNRGTV